MKTEILLLISRRQFWVGTVVAAALFTVLNWLPYLLTHDEPVHCGFLITGFPFTFHSVGGFAGSVHFDPRILTLDILIGLAVSLVVGYLLARIRERRA